jgi:hypothetical protein
VEDAQARWFELQLNSETRVTRSGRDDSALAFVDEALVEVTYRLDNGALVAIAIEVVSVPQD